MYLSQFKTVKEAKDFTRTFLSTQPMGIVTDPFYTTLVEHHPQRDEKVGCGIKHFVILRDAYANKVINLQRMDDTLTSISWVTCCSGKIKRRPTSMDIDISSAMREAIQDDINLFRSTANLVCVQCESTKDPNIDHVYPFLSLQKDFLKDNDPPTSTQKCPLTYRHVFEEGLFKDTWKTFHRDKATFQVLCRACNLKKGAH